MVKSFQFSRAPRILFKCGIIDVLPSLVHQYGSAVLIVTGKRSFLSSSNGDKFLNGLKDNGINYFIHSVEGEPSPDNIDQAVKIINAEKTDLVIGIGGGSVLDASKALSAMLYKEESVINYLEGIGTMEHPGTKIPFIAVPTTSGTGSEATKNAVLSVVGENGFKRSLRHENFVPDIALVDPELTIQCPREITAASGTDCFTQLTEAYLSTKSNDYTDALALKGLRSVKESLLNSYLDGNNVEARSGMSFAALTSGICLANAGLGAVHGFASSIGGILNIPHGVLCGTLMASANEINVKALRRNNTDSVALNKYAVLGELFTGEKGKTTDFYIDGFIQYLHKLTAELNLPHLVEFGLEEKDLELICRNTDIKNNPVKLDVGDLIGILEKRL
jgi:alcohol dehydrogenase class IV